MKKWIYLSCGIIFVTLGTIGIIIPLLPTTPFLLLAAACFLKSSDGTYQWLVNNRVYGKYISNYIEKKGVPVKIKVFSLVLLWSSIMFSLFYYDLNLWLKTFLIVVLITVSAHIILIKEKKK